MRRGCWSSGSSSPSAARRIDDATADRARRLARRRSEAAIDDPVRFLISDREFHVAIYRSSAQPAAGRFRHRPLRLHDGPAPRRGGRARAPSPRASRPPGHLRALRARDPRRAVRGFRGPHRAHLRHDAVRSGGARAASALDRRTQPTQAREHKRRSRTDREAATREEPMERRTVLKLALGAALGRRHGARRPGAGAGGRQGHRLSHAGARPAVLALPVEGRRGGRQGQGLRLPGARFPQQRPDAVAERPGLRSRAASPASCISPTDSSTAPSVLALAKKAGIPVVIADIGTNSGDYVSFIISDNYEGAHDVGTALAAALKKKGWENGSVGIVGHLAGPQERPGPHQGVPRRPEGGRLHGQAGRRCSRCSPTRPTRPSSSPRTC